MPTPTDKRYLVNMHRRGQKPRSVEVFRQDYDRITNNLLRNDAGRIVITEALEDGGMRTYFVAPSEISSLDELRDDFQGFAGGLNADTD